MTTLRQIIKDAYRESGIIQIGTDPDSDQLDEGLGKLTALISGVYQEEVGSQFEDINFGVNGITNVFGRERDREAFLASSYLRPSHRVLFNIDSPKTVFLSASPYDGALFAVIDVTGNFSTNNVVVNANGRKIESGTSVTLSTDGVNRRWMYRGDLAEWVRINDLTVDSDLPFPEEFRDLFMIKLAMRLHPRYLVDTRPETAMHYKKLLKRFRSRYSTKQEMPSELALYRTTRYRYYDYNIIEESLRFDQGLIY